MHDHFGFFLSYGSTTWVATVYSEQAWYVIFIFIFFDLLNHDLIE